MLLSSSKRWFYIHIPKCGGSTVAFRVIQHLDLPDKNRTEVQKDLHWHGLHSSVAENISWIRGNQDWTGAAFIRDPRSLLFSWYTAIHRSRPEEWSLQGFKYFVKTLEGATHSEGQLVRRTQESYVRGYDINLYSFDDFDCEFVRMCLDAGFTDWDDINVNISNRTADYREFYDDELNKYVEHHYADDYKLIEKLESATTEKGSMA